MEEPTVDCAGEPSAVREVREVREPSGAEEPSADIVDVAGIAEEVKQAAGIDSIRGCFEEDGAAKGGEKRRR